MKKHFGLLATAAIVFSALSIGCSTPGQTRSSTLGTHKSTATPIETLSITVDTTKPQSISPYFYGQNYWNWVWQWGGAAIEGTSGQVATLGIQLLRAGGINNDNNNYDVEHLPQPEPFDNAQLDAFIAYARLIGAEPLLQLPVLRAPDGSKSTPATAVEMIYYANRTKDYGLRFFSIGNEPDMYVEAGERPVGFNATQTCDTFASYAVAVRAEAPDAVIVGPDLAWKFHEDENDWLSPFLANCARHVDVVAVHRYPFESHLATDTAAFGDVISFRETVKNIRIKMAANGVGEKPLAITEANIGYSAARVKNTASPGTYAAGLWTADIMGAALEEGLWNLSFWHISDSADQQEWALGFYHGNKPRPAAHAYKIVSDALRTEMYSVAGATAGVSVYAGSNAGKKSVVAVNKTSETVRLEATGLSAKPAVFDVAPRSIASAAINGSGKIEMVHYNESIFLEVP